MRIFILAAALASAPAAAQFAAPPLDDQALAAIAGRENLQQIASARNTSVVSGNTISGPSQTGMITIDGNAFQNLNGLSVLSANTGNNVSINAAMNVNIALRP